ncbi:hypothetical protein SAMN04490357_3992 [Streptomyces misionensis]|uniref:Uncharacterized protein n=1 Tax=Streptomyces misionensis TaxID=67331 RepID=A0A1H4YGH8_9ACTN|nr:hypothetical protein SAMN04490357_3992 [Streptomyces misionensis]
MDAYDEDSGAAPGPDGSTGARPPEHAPERLPDGERDEGFAAPAHDGGFAEREPGREAVGRARPGRQPADGEPADPERTGPEPASREPSGLELLGFKPTDREPTDQEPKDRGRKDRGPSRLRPMGRKPSRPEPSAPETARPAPPHLETTRPETARPGATGSEPARPEPARPETSQPHPQPARQGILALSPRYQAAAALAVAAVAVGVGVHLLMVFLSVAPPNAVSKQHGKAVEAWVFPEFEQNWKLFAPNPLQQNIAVQVRAEVRTKDGSLITTGWTDLSAQDGAAIHGNLAPSHAQQNELRRAWDFLTATHTDDNRPVGMRGSLSEDYLRRIVVLRLYRTDPTSRDGVIQRVQVRSRTTNVQPPSWSDERVPDKPYYRELPWWTVRADEAAGGVR